MVAIRRQPTAFLKNISQEHFLGKLLKNWFLLKAGAIVKDSGTEID
jgi:hypothetical protein